MNEAEFLKSCRLQSMLRNLQYDESLSQKQRKKANELYKELCSHPQFPNVHPSVIEKMIEKVLRTKDLRSRA